tara:strand:- start:26594 stop:27805 length:1212 start_codon:yes stop_codon:yes gene_type:complete
MDITVSLAAVFFIVQSLYLRKWDWVRQKWVVVLLVLWAYMVARSFFVEDILTSLKVSFLYGRYFIFAAFFSTACSQSSNLSNKIKLVLKGVILFICVDTLAQYFFGANLFGHVSKFGHRLTGLFSRPLVGVYLSWLSFPIISDFFQRACVSKDYKKTVYPFLKCLGFALVTFLTIYASGERTAFLGALLCYGLMILFNFSVKRLVLGGVLVGVLLSSVAAFIILNGLIQKKQSIQATSSDTPSLQVKTDVQQRLISSKSSYHCKGGYGELFADALRLARSNIIFGIGMDQFKNQCLVNDGVIGNEKKCTYRHPHNAWLNIFAELGLVGVSLFCAFFFMIARQLRSKWHKYKSNGLIIGFACVLAYRFFPIAGGMSIFLSNNAPILWFLIGWLMLLLNESHKKH